MAARRRKSRATRPLIQTQAQSAYAFTFSEADGRHIEARYVAMGQLSEREYVATHVLNGMAWRLRDEFVSRRTDALNEGAQYAAKAFGYDHWQYKELAKSERLSRKLDLVNAVSALRNKR